jgi:hypothetical protein
MENTIEPQETQDTYLAIARQAKLMYLVGKATTKDVVEMLDDNDDWLAVMDQRTNGNLNLES